MGEAHEDKLILIILAFTITSYIWADFISDMFRSTTKTVLGIKQAKDTINYLLHGGPRPPEMPKIEIPQSEQEAKQQHIKLENEIAETEAKISLLDKDLVEVKKKPSPFKSPALLLEARIGELNQKKELLQAKMQLVELIIQDPSMIPILSKEIQA